LIDYDNDPNYEKEEEGVWRDINTNEMVYALSAEEMENLKKILNTASHQDEFILTEEEFEQLFNSDLNEL
jgi:L-2-hydroxyglutarate oxidase LhgO